MTYQTAAINICFWVLLKWYIFKTKAVVLPTVGWEVRHLIKKWMLGHCYHEEQIFFRAWIEIWRRQKVSLQPYKTCSNVKKKWRCEMNFNGVWKWNIYVSGWRGSKDLLQTKRGARQKKFEDNFTKASEKGLGSDV